MKRNMVPLLGIAFVVAIISTGVFYGLFAGKLRSSSTELNGRPIIVAARELERGRVVETADLRVSQMRGTLSGSFSKPEELLGATLVLPVKENEPFLQDRVALHAPASGESRGSVSSGMRAISIRVTESDGVVNLLHSGSKIDIQAVSDRNGNVELRTILENVEVLAVTPPSDPNRSGVRVVAVLTRAQDADVVALADSGARIRVALRNPLDEATSSPRPLTLASVFRPSAEHAALEKQATEAKSSIEHQLRLHVEVLAASAAALGELDAKLSALGHGRFHARGGLPARYECQRVAGVFEAETGVGDRIFAEAHRRPGAAGELSRQRGALPPARAVLSHRGRKRQCEPAGNAGDQHSER